MEQIVNYFKTHKIILALSIWGLLLAIIAIIAAVILLTAPPQDVDVFEVDPASGREVMVSSTRGPTNRLPEGDPGTLWLGFDELLGSHSAAWINSIMLTIQEYADEQQLVLQRVSVVQNTPYIVDDPSGRPVATTRFSVVLNVDQIELSAEVLTRANGTMRVKFINIDSGNLVFEREIQY